MSNDYCKDQLMTPVIELDWQPESQDLEPLWCGCRWCWILLPPGTPGNPTPGGPL